MNPKSKLHWLFVCLSLAGLLALVGCNAAMVTGSGNVITREFDFSDFDEVEIGHAFQGTVTQGDDYRVVVRIDDNLEEYLRAEQNGNRVSIGFENMIGITRATMEYEVVMPSLTALHASGATEARVSGFSSADAFTAEASGASRIEGDITTGDLTANASGASTITLNGSGGNVQADASGASTVNLEAFTTADANANASGASTITVNTTGRLDAEASGASNVYYVGQPTLGNIDESGGSDVSSR
jgi:hypothetical protein